MPLYQHLERAAGIALVSTMLVVSKPSDRTFKEYYDKYVDKQRKQLSQGLNFFHRSLLCVSSWFLKSAEYAILDCKLFKIGGVMTGPRKYPKGQNNTETYLFFIGALGRWHPVPFVNVKMLKALLCPADA